MRRWRRRSRNYRKVRTASVSDSQVSIASVSDSQVRTASGTELGSINRSQPIGETMNLVMTVIIYALLFATSTVAAFAQEKPQPAKAPEAAAKTTSAEPTVDQILDKYVQAIGGRQAVEKVTSRVTKGTFEVSAMGLKGEIEIYAKAPNKTLTIQNVSGVGEIQDGYDGKVAWSQNPMMGLREKSGAELAAIARASDIHASLKTREHFSKLELKGKEKVGNRETYVILATPAEGAPVKMCFDAQTGLIARTETDLET